MLGFIKKQYPENFALLNLRILEVYIFPRVGYFLTYSIVSIYL